MQVLPRGQPQMRLLQQPPSGHWLGGTQNTPLQQPPFGQAVCATQVPVATTQHWPVGQKVFSPSHSGVGALQARPLASQPFGQQLAPQAVKPAWQVQAPLTQVSLAPQEMHAWPLVPQAFALPAPLTQVPLLQHLPAGQGFCTLQGTAQWPPAQWPPICVQSWQLPPPVPQAVSLVPALQTAGWPPTVAGPPQQPAQRSGVQNCTHACPVQTSCAGSHAAQVSPPVPHALGAVPGRHCPFWQQPPAQLLAVQTHCPFWQV